MEDNKNAAQVVGETVLTEAKKGVQDAISPVTSAVDTVKGTVDTAKKVGGYLKRDIGNALEWLSKSPEEKAAEKQKEKEEKEAKEAEEKAAAEAEEKRLKELEKTYILHTAVILCDKAQHESFVVLPTSHGEFIHGIPQLNVGDSKPNVNIRSFGICRSPKNPSVQAAAKKILDDINNREKGFMDRVLDLFSKPSSEVCDSEESLAAYCAGECNPQICMEWTDGKEDVLVDGKPALLGKGKLSCQYGGAITIYTSGQMEE